MSKKAVSGTVVALVIAMIVIVLVWVLAGKILNLGKSASSYVGVCPGDTQIKSECYCGGEKIRTGYCCDFKKSDKPCFCVKDTIASCAGYKDQGNCTQNSCKLLVTKCSWDGAKCA